MTMTHGDTGVCTQGDNGGYAQADLGPCEQETTGADDNYEMYDGNSEHQQEDP